MITYQEALDKILNSASCLNTERVNILDAYNRVLAVDVYSDINMPPFNKSAMDGYACKRQDINNLLDIIEIIPAGKSPVKKIEKNQCSKIMTGAMIPDGADCVIMVEDVSEIDGKKIKINRQNTNNNIAYKSEDIKVGDMLLEKNKIITPHDIAILATAGKYEIEVIIKPKIAILSTGDELVEPYKYPEQSQIRNSNAYQLYSQIIKSGSLPKYYGIALDNEKDTERLITNAVSENDVLILTGGVSMGDFDHVPSVLKKIGFEQIVHNIAIQPGKPTLFAKNNDKYVFGLPGNPVSSYVIFEIIVKPFLYKLMGAEYEFLDSKYLMSFDYKRKKAERLSWIPVRINSEGEIMQIEYHGSAHINSLSFANALLPVEIGKLEIKKGEKVSVRQF